MTTHLTKPVRLSSAFEPNRAELLARYRHVRETTERLCAPLETEDYVAQSMPDASPVKWHLAHSTWFFETFLLKPNRDGQGVAPAEYAFLFNSYYNALGERIARPHRGLLTRPTVAEVFRYRADVDDEIDALLKSIDEPSFRRISPMIVLGLNHEQQHQELILTDLKHLFGANPVRPVYRETSRLTDRAVPPMRWVSYPGGLSSIGHDGPGFAFDNELPRHRVYSDSYRLSSRPVTNGEYLEFIADRGYDRPELWLSDGWNSRQANGWTAPLYWQAAPEGWRVFTMSGEQAIVASEPVCHISYYEADAYSRWAGARLPTEAEWECAAHVSPIQGNFLESEHFHPQPLPAASSPAVLEQIYGDVWEWTSSPYVPYPGFRPASGAIGEYNGKFMCNQMVLRGGSCATPRSHIRSTYRNFFPPEARWQFAGLRLANEERNI